MAIRRIPSDTTPRWICNINNVVYAYPSGTEQDVPEEVADIIDKYEAAQPRPNPMPGSIGQVWTRTDGGAGWRNILAVPPATATGKYLASSSDGTYGWDALPNATATRYGCVMRGEAVDLPTPPASADDVLTCLTALVATVSDLIESLEGAHVLARAVTAPSPQ